MNKIIRMLLCLIIIFMLSGCGSSYSCSKKYNENIKYKLKVTFDLDKDKTVTSSNAVFTFDTSDDANNFCKVEKILGKSNNIVCTNKTVRIKNYHTLLSSKETIKKDEIINILKNDGMKCI